MKTQKRATRLSLSNKCHAFNLPWTSYCSPFVDTQQLFPNREPIVISCYTCPQFECVYLGSCHTRKLTGNQFQAISMKKKHSHLNVHLFLLWIVRQCLKHDPFAAKVVV